MFVLSVFAQDTAKFYWSNEALMSVGIMQNGKEDGQWSFFHKNGTKWSEGNYRQGEKVGLWKMWYDNGQLSQEYYADKRTF